MLSVEQDENVTISSAGLLGVGLITTCKILFVIPIFNEVNDIIIL